MGTDIAEARLQLAYIENNVLKKSALKVLLFICSRFFLVSLPTTAGEKPSFWGNSWTCTVTTIRFVGWQPELV